MKYLKILIVTTVYGFAYGGLIGGIILIAIPSLSVYWPFEWSEFNKVDDKYKNEAIAPIIILCIIHLLEGVLWGVCIGSLLGFITGLILIFKENKDIEHEIKEE